MCFFLLCSAKWTLLFRERPSYPPQTTTYKAYIQSLLKYGREAKTSQLTTQLWLQDIEGQMDDESPRNGSNTALLNRAKMFEGGKSVDMVGPLYHDLFKMDIYLLNQVNVNVKLYRSKPEFCLMSGLAAPEYKVVLEDVRLRANKVRVNPAVIYAQSKALEMTVTGAYDQNPWFFKSYDVTSIGLYTDGIPVGGNPLTLKYEAAGGHTIISVLRSMLQTTGKWLNDAGVDIDRNDAAEGYALCTCELEPSFRGDQYLTLLKQGYVRLETTFGTALPEAVSCVIYTEYPGYFEINTARDIIQP